MKVMGRAPLIVIEGIDRIGKNTQAELLVARLRDRGIAADLFSTPEYAEDVNGLIERFLKQEASVESSDYARVANDNAVVLECLQICNRYQVADRIRKSVMAGRLAVCVRWWQSALIYGQHDRLDVEWIRRTCSALPGADLNILIEVDPNLNSSRYKPSDHYEGKIESQARMAMFYRDLWIANMTKQPGEEGWEGLHAIVNGVGLIFEVSARIESVVDDYFARRTEIEFMEGRYGK
jgi:dTMP kinase